MIPCKKTCADYYEGCHKNCERWKLFLQQSSAERKEKKAYLNAYNELCSTIVRQCRANTLRRQVLLPGLRHQAGPPRRYRAG